MQTAGKGREIFGQRTVELDVRACCGMNEAERFCMQALALQLGDHLTRAVNRIPGNRMADARKMYADLMGFAQSGALRKDV